MIYRLKPRYIAEITIAIKFRVNVRAGENWSYLEASKEIQRSGSQHTHSEFGHTFISGKHKRRLFISGN